MRLHLTTVFAAFAAATAASACSSEGISSPSAAPEASCEQTSTCPASGGASSGGTTASGGGTGSGGTSSGGAESTGGGTGSGGAAPDDGGSGGAALDDGGLVDPPEEDCDFPIDFKARKDTTGAKYPVPAGTIDLYQCFSFKVDLPAGIQAVSFEPRIDQKRVIHHYLLYKMMIPQVDGVTSPCVGLHRDGLLVDGWAPGQEGVKMPPDVGMDIGDGNFLMEIHYNNFGDSVEDASGLRVCATTKKRKNTATLSWLGTEAIVIPPVTKGLKVTSRCVPPSTQPITIVRSWPHMHLLGRRMTADIIRSTGKRENLFDKPFDFNSQMGYETPAVLQPGDAVETTCVYDNDTPLPVTFGEGTQSEMCYNFTVAYPAFSLQAGGLHSTSCNN